MVIHSFKDFQVLLTIHILKYCITEIANLPTANFTYFIFSQLVFIHVTTEDLELIIKTYFLLLLSLSRFYGHLVVWVSTNVGRALQLNCILYFLVLHFKQIFVDNIGVLLGLFQLFWKFAEIDAAAGHFIKTIKQNQMINNREYTVYLHFF